MLVSAAVTEYTGVREKALPDVLESHPSAGVGFLGVAIRFRGQVKNDLGHISLVGRDERWTLTGH